MSQKIGPYQVVDLPAGRRESPNLNELYWWKHSVYGLLEVDVSVAREFIEAYKVRTGETLSFTGYLTFCLARAVDENKAVQAYLKGHKQLVIFDDVDVAMLVERQISGTRAPMLQVIRRANHRTYLDIHREIRSIQSQPLPPRAGAGSGLPRWVRFGLRLPGPLASLFLALIRARLRHDPTHVVALGGTVAVTAVGMFGPGMSGWGLTPPAHSLLLIVGSISRKPAVVEGRIEPREILNLTVAFDHDVVDGAPAARFVRRLVELVESGYGLAEDDRVPYQPLGWHETERVIR